VSYARNTRLAERSKVTFDDSVTRISHEYQELTQCLVEINQSLRFTAVQAQSFSLEQAVEAKAPFDCEPFDRIRSRIETHLSQAAMLHAQIVCSTMTIVNNIHHAYICGPRIPQFCEDPVDQGTPIEHPPDTPGHIGDPVEAVTPIEHPPGHIGDPVEEDPHTGHEPNDKVSRRSRR
jgi:hypothetical protein